MTAPNGLDHVRPVFRRILVQGAVLAAALAVVGGLVGFLVAGGPGLAGGLIGAVMSVVFCGLTAVSVLLAIRFSGGQMISGAFFGTIMGMFLVKFVLFIVVLVLLKDRDWVSTPVLAIAIIVGVIGSLVIDVTVISKARVPIDVRLPGAASTPEGSAEPEKDDPRV
ncbi:hypothetical protein EDF24_3284 [Curtobacterium sp. PhB130]|uniref:hypothetical protein n=1 Tax=unclassified Curtobacterium TaxID=257496 RepID=UPI000F4BFEBB|nr:MULTISPECIES: hypothetical protein [unclassified Curtobacterium]ROP66369.1 hypothetical protein EDF55_0823 [Curtobacterium sp. ZW137]ROS73175.1 hypothetical protein EDF24_3284 [Curtobacterium sp. PhB130]TCK61245.1 hypothetical protein EDF27_2956 [Curtobacterium sp. PhB136]